MSTDQGEDVTLAHDLKENWLDFTYELREAVLNVLGPLPYLVLLLLVLSVGSRWLGPFGVLFALALIASFFYLMVVCGVNLLRVSLARRKEAIPEAEDRYVEGTWSDRFGFIVYDALFGYESEHEPIIEHQNTSIGHYLGFAYVSLAGAMVAFLSTGVGLAWWLNNGDISFAAGFVNEYGPLLRRTLPVTPVDLIFGFLPFLGELAFKDQVFVVGVLFMTGFVFLTGARCLIAAADELHRRALRWMVSRSPLPHDEVLPLGIILGFYFLLLT